jgi:hypothetical protein
MKRRRNHRLFDDDLPPFRFSEDARATISEALPADVHRWISTLEDIVRRYLDGYPDDLAGRQKKWSRIEKGAQELAGLIRQARVHPDSHEWIVLMLGDLARDANLQARQYHILTKGKRRERRRLEREWLYHALSDFWVKVAGRKLSYYNAYEDRGLTVHFFKTVLLAIPGEDIPSDDTIVDAIRRNRERLREGMVVSGDEPRKAIELETLR